MVRCGEDRRSLFRHGLPVPAATNRGIRDPAPETHRTNIVFVPDMEALAAKAASAGMTATIIGTALANPLRVPGQPSLDTDPAPAHPNYTIGHNFNSRKSLPPAPLLLASGTSM